MSDNMIYVFPTSLGPGMTLRDYFAAEALAGVASGFSDLGSSTTDQRREVFGKVAVILYEMADAMLAERAKT